MKLRDMLAMLIDKDRLIAIETEDGQCMYCGPVDDVEYMLVCKLIVMDFYPEHYGKYNHLGITFVVE